MLLCHVEDIRPPLLSHPDEIADFAFFATRSGPSALPYMRVNGQNKSLLTDAEI